MASVHKRKKSKYWMAAFRGQGGRLFLRSTKQENRDEAMKVALAYQKAAKLSMAGELTEAVARDVLNDIMKSVGADTMRSPVIADWLNEWLDAKEGKQKPSTIGRYRSLVNGFIKHLGDRAQKRLSSLVPRDISAYLAKRLKEDKVSPTTANLDGMILRMALGRARKNGLVSANVAEAVDLPTADSVERVPFTSAEVSLLVDAAEGEWKTLILVAYFTGARLGDCRKLPWSDVDLTKGIITFKRPIKRTQVSVLGDAGSTKNKVTVPIHAELLNHLLALATSDQPQTYVMPALALPEKPGGRSGLSETFKEIATKAGVDLMVVQGSGKSKLARKTFHCLRHSFTSELANHGVGKELRQKLTGHKDDKSHERYTHHELETLRRAVDKLPSLPPPAPITK